MMVLARVVDEHPHAVQRDLLCHGFRWGGLGAPEDRLLDLPRFASFVLGAPPASPVGHAVSDGWSTEAHLLANLAEQHAGLLQLTDRYPRPGVAERKPDEDQVTVTDVKAAENIGGAMDRFDTPEDFQTRLNAFRELARQRKAGGRALPSKEVDT